MNILIINCHWDNRGDEAAIRAMIDELQIRYPEAMIYVQRALGEFGTFPTNDRVKTLSAFPVGGRRRGVQEWISYHTNGRINLTKGAREFYKVLHKADIVIHAPGGPSIGDLYMPQEVLKLRRLKMVKRSGAKYAFYAPSMGPFKNEERNPDRREVLRGASLICLREQISQKMVKEFVPETNPIVTLDSAFQHLIDVEENQKIYDQYQELKEFVGDGSNVIGMTITDLQWHHTYNGNVQLKDNIRNSFTEFISDLSAKGFKVLFIPQLFENANDYNYMSSFAVDDCYVMSDQYDCYFQQYVISMLRAVVGMRYHSNIFSAKMGTPFVSIAYEQKMQGFMEKADLEKYCLPIDQLSVENLKSKFEYLLDNYNEYKSYLSVQKDVFRMEASRTTDLICQIIDNK